MQIQRVTSLLHGLVDVRNWMANHIPLSSSMLGYDLFMKIGNDCFSGVELELDKIYRDLPHSQEAIRAQLASMEEAGLLVERPCRDGHAMQYVPTQQFIDLLKQYQSKFESLFILREDLRKRQLFALAPNQRLQQVVEVLYDHFYDLDWLYVPNFASVCFLMSSLVKRVAVAHGLKAEVEICHVEIRTPTHRFLVGSPGLSSPGQIEGHAVCVIEDAMLVDFGLGNVRRDFRSDFYWGLACAYQPQDAVIAHMQLPQGESVTWKNDWQTPDGPAEFVKYEGLVERLFQRYVDRFG